MQTDKRMKFFTKIYFRNCGQYSWFHLKRAPVVGSNRISSEFVHNADGPRMSVE